MFYEHFELWIQFTIHLGCDDLVYGSSRMLFKQIFQTHTMNNEARQPGYQQILEYYFRLDDRTLQSLESCEVAKWTICLVSWIPRKQFHCSYFCNEIVIKSRMETAFDQAHHEPKILFLKIMKVLTRNSALSSRKLKC